MSAVVGTTITQQQQQLANGGEDERAKLATQNGLSPSLQQEDSSEPMDCREDGEIDAKQPRRTIGDEDCAGDVTLNGVDANCTATSESSNCTMDDSECNVTVIHVTVGAKDETIVPLDDEQTTTDASPLLGEKKGFAAAESKDSSKDGSDSGVEGCGNVEQPRVPSRNSGDYASSNGLDEASCDSSLVSCCSVYEDAPCSTLPDDVLTQLGNDRSAAAVGEAPENGGSCCPVVAANLGGEGTSEGGSESSSIAGSISNGRLPKRANSLSSGGSSEKSKKKLTSHGSIDSHNPRGRPLVNGTTSTGARLTKQKPAVPPRSSSSTLTKSQSLNRGRTREKSATAKDGAKETSTRDGSVSTGSNGRSTSTARTSVCCSSSAQASTAASRSRARPDSLPSALTTEINKDLAQRGRGAGLRPRGGSTTRTSTTTINRTPGSTPSEDGRKAMSTVARSSSLYSGRIDVAKSTRHLDKMTTSVDSARTLETYGTLPRSARHSNKFSIAKSSSSDKPPVANRSRSGSRDASLNRLLGRKAVQSSKDATQAHKGLPPYPKYKVAERTRIYHETGVQTGLTSKDIDNCLAGVATIIPNPESVDTLATESQTEGSWEDLQQVKADLKKVSAESEENKKENEKLKAEVERLKKQLDEEKADHAFARQELDKNAQRVLAMLGTPQSEHADGSDSFLELESQIQSSGQVVANQQVEIADLQSLCRMLSRDLEKSLAAQKALLQQQQELEAESMEMQDFLQEEKATLEIALKESESESQKKDENIKQLSSELERQTEECKHLVRISEQRRQENLSLSMKLNAIERRSKELLLAQGAAASGASVALSGLGSRLEGLVDQLIMSYLISEKDLEDVIYHNEAFSRSNSSIESSPVSSKHSLKDCTPSPKRGSFVSAVIGAIRNAATHPFATKQINEKKSADSSKAIRKELSSMESSSDLLDFETEPCLMMESVLEDVPLPDTYSHNMVSSCDSLRRVLSVPESVDEHNLRKSKLNGESSSLSNLTQAILNRRKVEDEEEENYESISESENGPSEGPLPLTDYCPATSLVDQVIDVDNLVTKLLKVLRIIQLDNDTCIQELKDERAELETRLEILLVERKAVENGQVAENEILTNGVHDETIVVENCKNVIKEMKDAKELITDGQIEKTNCISEESGDGDQNATILLSPSVCS